MHTKFKSREASHSFSYDHVTISKSGNKDSDVAPTAVAIQPDQPSTSIELSPL